MAGKHKLEYIEQDCPKFLKDLKARVNYKEGPTLETKRVKPAEESDEDEVEREDEKPTVCVLRPGDLTQEEYEREKLEHSHEKNLEETCSSSEPSKIVFKKPTKVKNSDNGDKKVKELVKKKSKRKSEARKVKDTKLLSFEEDDED